MLIKHVLGVKYKVNNVIIYNLYSDYLMVTIASILFSDFSIRIIIVSTKINISTCVIYKQHSC